MTLTDLMIKARVNLALARDRRVSSLEIGVQSDDGIVTLTGDVDSPHEVEAALDQARSIEGVRQVVNNITCGIGRDKEAAEMVSQRFLEKLEEVWNELPEQSALAQADYLKWALWMIAKLRIPDVTGQETVSDHQAKTTNDAILAVASRVNCPPVLLALELQRIAEEVEPLFNESGPRLVHADLVTSEKRDEGNTELAA